MFIAVPQQCYNKPDVDYTGNDIGAKIPPSDADACRAYCASVSGATHFTMNQNDCIPETNTGMVRGQIGGHRNCHATLSTLLLNLYEGTGANIYKTFDTTKRRGHASTL